MCTDMRVMCCHVSGQNENDYNSANTNNVAGNDDNDICVAIKPFALHEHDKRSGCAAGTPQTAKRVRRSSDAQEVLQDVTFRLDGPSKPDCSSEG